MKSENYVENLPEIGNGRVQAVIISIVSGIVLLFAVAAASRAPEFWQEQAYFHVGAAALFLIFAAAMMCNNIYTHVQLSRQTQLKQQDSPTYNVPTKTTVF